MSALRALDERKFDFLAGVFFDENFLIYRAALVPWEVVCDRAVYVKHTNAWRFMLTDAVWEIPGVQNLDLRNQAPTAPSIARSVRPPTSPTTSIRSLDHDRTRYNLIGGPGRGMGKGHAMLALVIEFVRRGVAPDIVVARIPRSERFLLCSVEGIVSAHDFQASVATTSGGIKRYYVNDADLIHFGDRNYALTSQWTLDLLRLAGQSLAGLCATNGVLLEEVT